MTAQLYPTGQELLDGATLLAGQVKYLALFKNPATLMKGFNPAVLTECDFSSYARQDISGGWNPASIDVNGNGTCLNTLRTFTKSGATPNPDVYGFFYVDAGGNVLWAQLFADGPYPMVTDGDVIRINPPLVSFGGPLFP